jgi:hypothetical protein
MWVKSEKIWLSLNWEAMLIDFNYAGLLIDVPNSQFFKKVHLFPLTKHCKLMN